MEVGKVSQSRRAYCRMQIFRFSASHGRTRVSCLSLLRPVRLGKGAHMSMHGLSRGEIDSGPMAPLLTDANLDAAK